MILQYHFSHTDTPIQQHLPGSPSSSELLSEISGMLINSHPVFDYPKQWPPTFFQIGGIHIKTHKALQGVLLSNVNLIFVLFLYFLKGIENFY